MKRHKFKIELNPVTKKNHSRIIFVTVKGRRTPKLVPSKAYARYEKAAPDFCPKLHISYPVNIEAHYYMATRHKVDLVNLHEALHDILVLAGTIEDDNSRIIVSTDGSRVHYDKDHPRTEVIITEIRPAAEPDSSVKRTKRKKIEKAAEPEKDEKSKKAHIRRTGA